VSLIWYETTLMCECGTRKELMRDLVEMLGLPVVLRSCFVFILFLYKVAYSSKFRSNV